MPAPTKSPFDDGDDAMPMFRAKIRCGAHIKTVEVFAPDEATARRLACIVNDDDGREWMTLSIAKVEHVQSHGRAR